MSTPDLTFPTLGFDPESDWEWPRPSYAVDDPRPPMMGAPEPCRLEFVNGRVLEGEMLAMDVQARRLTFRRGVNEAGVPVAFADFRRLSLHALWEVRRASADSPVEATDPQMQVREYVADCGVHTLKGRTAGMVESDAGWFLFTPVEEGRTLMRVFVPAASCRGVEMSKSVQEKAAERWVRTPEQLLAAVQAQKTAKVLPMGEALVDLGLIAPDDVQRVLAQYERHSSNKPLGERLVEAGWIRRDDLQTALAYKMGYPIVDVLRFPIDIDAVRCVPHRVLLEQHAMPLMKSGNRMFIAVDTLQSIPPLQSLRSVANLQIVPVLAPRAALRTALVTLSQRLGSDPWAHNVASYL